MFVVTLPADREQLAAASPTRLLNLLLKFLLADFILILRCTSSFAVLLFLTSHGNLVGSHTSILHQRIHTFVHTCRYIHTYRSIIACSTHFNPKVSKAIYWVSNSSRPFLEVALQRFLLPLLFLVCHDVTLRLHFSLSLPCSLRRNFETCVAARLRCVLFFFSFFSIAVVSAVRSASEKSPHFFFLRAFKKIIKVSIG